MQLIKHQTNINFMGQRKLALVISAVLIVISIVSLSTRGLNYGLDFTGGTLIQLKYETDPNLNEIRDAMAAGGFPGAVVQSFGDDRDVLVRIGADPDTEGTDAAFSEAVATALAPTSDQPIQKVREEFVGPQVGDELTNKGGVAMIFALICILIYIIMRFQWKFSIGAVLALIHDVMIIVGFFSITQVEFDLTVLAALLAVIGYSLNDTIVVYDRIRENFRTMRKGDSFDIFNTSINQMLARTLMTSLTTLLVLASLFFLGGDIIHSFAEALIVGVIIGTYSSIYIAATTLLMLDVNKMDLIEEKKSDPQLDAMP